MTPSSRAKGRPRLVYLHQYFRCPGQSGGMRSWEIARRLAEHYDLHMVTSSSSDDRALGTWRTRSVGQMTVHEYALDDPHLRSNEERMSSYLRFAAVAAKKAWQLDPDVVYATSTPLTIAIPALSTRVLRRAPFVFEVRDLWPDAPIAVGALTRPSIIRAARLLERAAYRAAHSVVALSPPQADAVASRGARRVSTVPNFSNPDLFGPRSAPTERTADLGGLLPDLVADRPLVLYPGTMGLVNGAGWLVDVAAASARHDGEPESNRPIFAIVGSGREESQIRHRAAELGVLDKNFFLLGEVAKTDMPALLDRAQLICDLIIDRPDLWKASPNKVFDAFAAQTPLLINHGGWIADLLGETGAGLVADHDDPAGAARSITALVASPEKLEAAARASADLAKRFDVDRGCDEIATRIADALARNP